MERAQLWCRATNLQRNPSCILYDVTPPDTAGGFLFLFFFPIFGHFVAVCAYLMQISKFKMNFKIQTALNTQVFSYFLICTLAFSVFRPFRVS